MITLTKREDIAAVEITITAPEGAHLVSLERADTAGTRPVRLYAGQDFAGGTLTVVDREAALVGPITYRYRAEDAVGTYSASADITLEGITDTPRIDPVIIPVSGISLAGVMEYQASRPTSTVEYQVIGRAAPIFSIGYQSSRRVSMDLFARDYSEVRAIEEVCGTGEILMLRDPQYGLDMYFIPTQTTVTPHSELTTPRRWAVSVQAVEVDPPSGNIRGSRDWTIEASALRNATLAYSLEEFPLLGTLAVGPIEYV